MGQFPIGVGITELRGVLEILKENRGALSLAKLAEESEKEIDVLLPLLDAGELLGLLEIKEGVVKLTEEGKKLKLGNIAATLSRKLKEIEPFSTIIEFLKEKDLTTSEIAEGLKSRDIILNPDDATNIELLRNMLIKWGIRTKLFSYNRDSDLWSRKKR
ncbi:MAG: AAA-associated domain-containing protein [Candidatus Micrarchaeia archaeon]|jgi:NitT/TauT family transport system ATP-binding protein